jgi:excisionase family DNA binding protein
LQLDAAAHCAWGAARVSPKGLFMMTMKVEPPAPAPDNRLAYRVEEFAKMAGVSTPFVWVEIRKGNLQSLKVGRRRLILAKQAAEYLERHVA